MTDNLPARASFTGQHDVPLDAAPSTALAFALGYAVARPQNADAFGPFCAMVEQLQARPAVGPHGEDYPLDLTNAWVQLMGLLPAPLARQIDMLYQAQRGQRWARTGQRHPKSGK